MISQSPNADRSSEEGRAFFQLRFSQYLGGYAMLGGMFVVLRTVGQMTAPGTATRWAELTRPDYWAHIAGVLISVAGWLYARGAPKAAATLERGEMLFVCGTMLAYSTMGFYLPFELGGTVTSYLALTMGLFARAIFVPSTGRRSFILACAVAIPSLAMTYYGGASAKPEYVALLMRYAKASDAHTFLVGYTMSWSAWWVGTVVMTTSASKVIYGLRREVRDAKQLGQYKLEDKLGEGGMGVVYRASHALLQRPTAVKLLPEDKVGEKSLARFEREVRLTAKLTHPNTITIFDYGRTPEGVFYYAMELLDGATLGTLVERTGPVTPARAAHIFLQVAGALSEAHGIGLIHRDIKPANIMLAEQGGIVDTVKVLDFGLVKELAQGDEAALTQDVITGTPQYMPPEAMTNPESIDARSDIYSLGAVMFYLLTGEHLFSGATVVEVCGHHLHTVPRRASELADVPEVLDDLVHACLAKAPAQRPQTANEIVEQLESARLADGWTRKQARAWWHDNGDTVGQRGLGLRGASSA